MLIGISSDPILADSDRYQLFCRLQNTWHIYGSFHFLFSVLPFLIYLPLR